VMECTADAPYSMSNDENWASRRAGPNESQFPPLPGH
jgi:hypothetical protein